MSADVSVKNVTVAMKFVMLLEKQFRGILHRSHGNNQNGSDGDASLKPYCFLVWIRMVAHSVVYSFCVYVALSV